MPFPYQESSNEKQGDFDDTEYESKSHEEQDSYEISAEFSDKKNLENSDSQIFDKELKQLELEDFKHDLVVEEEIDRPVTPKIKFEKKDDETITMKIEWGPLIRQERTGGLIIKLENGRVSVCGSTLLTNYHVVTAAHCGMDNNHIATNVTIVFASTKIFKGGTRRNVTSILLHPNYQVKFIQNDVALMSMKYTQYDGKWINRIVLPAGTLMKEKFVGVKLRAAGYGRTSDSESEKGKQTLRTVDIKILNTSDCLKVYGKKVVTNKTLCGDGTFGGTCFGDSGGPLVLIRPGGKHVLVGITSFGSGKGCEKKIPLGYSRVSYFKPWIMKEIKTHTSLIFPRKQQETFAEDSNTGQSQSSSVHVPNTTKIKARRHASAQISAQLKAEFS
ncbi:collagenase-like [Hyposmocoma kahamanoa]|uniref:collagenase-like n=1 Tax=Hyposmocoma kahamanoa TaxID=1477025 RepID=UPI000E6D9C12|nr:collagenase-like [Hyposmocoma kahamanoa]